MSRILETLGPYTTTGIKTDYLPVHSNIDGPITMQLYGSASAMNLAIEGTLFPNGDPAGTAGEWVSLETGITAEGLFVCYYEVAAIRLNITSITPGATGVKLAVCYQIKEV